MLPFHLSDKRSVGSLADYSFNPNYPMVPFTPPSTDPRSHNLSPHLRSPVHLPAPPRPRSVALAEAYTDLIGAPETPNIQDSFLKGLSPVSIRESVQRHAPIIAELRTNVIVKDEFTLVMNLTSRLAAQYNRSNAGIAVRIDHSACLALGGNFDPCYTLTIATVSFLLSPTANRRNAPAIQSLLADTLSVPAHRGLIIFHNILEENLAIKGSTVSSRADHLEQLHATNSGSPPAGNSRNMQRGIQVDHRSTTPSRAHTLPHQSFQGVPQTLPNFQLVPPSTTNFVELPAMEIPQQRPRSAHSSSVTSPSMGLNMNGISHKRNRTKSLTASRGRPQTIAGNLPTLHHSYNDSPFPKHSPTNDAPISPLEDTGTPFSSRRNQHLPPLSTKSVPQGRDSKASQPQPVSHPTNQRQQYYAKPISESHIISNDSSLPTPPLSGPPSPLPVPSKMTERSSAIEPQVTTHAITVPKAMGTRSTITAVPRLPTTSQKSAPASSPNRLPKRKSFLAVFRRSSGVAA